MDSNIPESIIYSALVGEFLRIARSTEDFIGKARELWQRMLSQGANSYKVSRNLRKIICRHSEYFSRFQILPEMLITQIL